MSVVNGEVLQPALDRVWLGEGSASEIFAAAAEEIQAKVDESKVIS
jgi:hypothetical protein